MTPSLPHLSDDNLVWIFFRSLSKKQRVYFSAVFYVEENCTNYYHAPRFVFVLCRLCAFTRDFLRERMRKKGGFFWQDFNWRLFPLRQRLYAHFFELLVKTKDPVRYPEDYVIKLKDATL